MPGQASPEEVRHHVEGIEAGRHHDVELELLGDPRHPGDIPAETEGRRVDDGVDAGLLELCQPPDRIVDPFILVAPHLGVVLQDLW